MSTGRAQPGDEPARRPIVQNPRDAAEEEFRLRELLGGEAEVDEFSPERQLGHTVYCGQCGYCLRYLPYRGFCPECGGEYDARALSMRGIFLSSGPEVPFGYMVGTLAVAALAGALVGRSLDPFDSGPVFLGLLLGVGSVYMAVQSVKGLAACLHHARLQRVVMRQERDEEEDW